jgi:Outer membrane protein beta-barrel domain
MKSLKTIVFLSVFVLFSYSTLAQSVRIGPRITGNFNIYNQDGLTGTWNGIGVGFGGTVDMTFGKTIGIMTNLIMFDMRNFSNSQTQNNVNTETSLTLSYLTITPMFKAEFSGFYMVAGPSFGIKLNSSGEQTRTVTGQTPNVSTLNIETNSLVFDIAVGTGYNFKLSPGLVLGSDIMVFIPISKTYDTPGVSNSIFTIKLGASLKFQI